MQFILFTIIAAFVAMGVHRMSRNIQPGKTRFTRTARKEALTAHDMVQCPHCQAYVLPNVPHGDCPYPPSPPAA